MKNNYFNKRRTTKGRLKDLKKLMLGDSKKPFKDLKLDLVDYELMSVSGVLSTDSYNEMKRLLNARYSQDKQGI